jgi:hypothetical protein
MSAHAAAVRAEFFWCCVDHLLAPSLETMSRLHDARTAANAEFTQAECYVVTLAADEVRRHRTWC